jgi:hypothetical protein
LKKDKRSFRLKNANIGSDSKSILENIKYFFIDNSLTPMLNIEFVGSDAEVSYLEISDGGNFVNFGGFVVNTESGMACLGYSPNNEGYIPVFDFVEFFNVVIFGGNNLLGRDEVLYIIETFKLDFRNFDIKGYINSIIKGLRAGGDRYKSVILNFLGETTDVVTDLDVGPFEYMSNEDIFKALFIGIKGAIKNIDALGKEFFGQFGVEGDREEVIKGMEYDVADLISAKSFGGVKGYESLYLKSIKDRGVDSDFARELSSVGFGLDMRGEIIKDSKVVDIRRDLALLSSGLYASIPKKSDLGKVKDETLAIGNIIDILRGIGRDQDLFFSYDVVVNLGEDKILKGLLKSLSIEDEVSTIGEDKFVEGIREYAVKMLPLVDSGSVYGKNVSLDQKSFVTFSSRGLINSGRIFSKIFGRLSKKF